MSDLNAADPVSSSQSRTVADILREAGISSAAAGGRRRRRDDSEAALAEPEPEDAEPEHHLDSTEVWPSAAEEVSGLSAYLLADRETRDVPPAPVAPKLSANLPVRKLAPRTDTGPVTAFGWVRPGTAWSADSASAAASSTVSSSVSSEPTAVPGIDLPTRIAKAVPGAPQLDVGAPKAVPGTDSGAATVATSAPAHGNRSPSPLSGAPAPDPAEESAVAVRGGAAGWAILVVELLAAAGLGVGAWYAFSALWELLPYVAAFAGPLVVTGLVAVAGALRARTGRNPLGLPTLCILVFAGTVLVVLPAATVIIP